MKSLWRSTLKMFRSTGLSDEPLVPGPTTFTLERIHSRLRHDSWTPDPGSPQAGIPGPFLCEFFGYSLERGVLRCYTDLEQNERRERFCRDLYERALDPTSHCSRLDDRFSQILSCNLRIEGKNDISDHTYHLLTRLPTRPLQLPDEPPALSPDYSNHEFPGDGHSTATVTLWDDLQVTSHVSANVIRVALLSVIYPDAANHMLQPFLDTVADLIGTASKLSLSADSELARQSWFVVRAFLWTSWQRCSMIYSFSLVGGYLKVGFGNHEENALLLRGMETSPGLSIEGMSRKYAGFHKPQYMCGWAFELLRNNPVCIGLDFRRFFFRYSMAFGDRPGRCLRDHPASCKGDAPGNCQRFRGMRIENQSLHDDVCQGDCERLTWDEESYRSVSGARAVALEPLDSRKELIYCQASANTLAVSHVWSHGQGGRPELGHGFNHCLHRRYVSIARSLGCDSYWMDTPCIPEEHKLRREAIENINQIFEQSKATVVCDKDLMGIDGSDLSMEVCETIIAILMVCDWNLRAWTFLEAFRGRENMYVLCKGNLIIPLKEIFGMVHRRGSIEIAYLMLCTPHLLPSRVKKDFRAETFNTSVNGFFTVESAGSLLSHREASRPGDEIVIWSLLLDDAVYQNVKAFWKSRQNQGLNTSFLVSSVPRLKERGLGWAPSSPSATLVETRSNGRQARLLALGGMDSWPGLIREDGFSASWLMYDFIGHRIGAKRFSSFLDVVMAPEDKSCRANLQEIRHRFLRGYLWGALLRPLNGSGAGKPAPDRGDSSRILVVVCATNRRFRWPFEKDDEIRWRWRGVYEWDMAEPLPTFVKTDDVLLV